MLSISLQGRVSVFRHPFFLYLCLLLKLKLFFIMSKFLSFETTNNGTVLFPIGDGCFMNVIGGGGKPISGLAITNGIITVIMAGTNISQSLIDSINNAQVQAFQTSWTQAVSVVSIPSGTTIDSVTDERGGGDAGPDPGPEGPPAP